MAPGRPTGSAGDRRTYSRVIAPGDVFGHAGADSPARTTGGTLHLRKGTVRAARETFATGAPVRAGFHRYGLRG